MNLSSPPLGDSGKQALEAGEPESGGTFDGTLHGAVVCDTVRWLERAVIGLNLCPFAKAVHARGQIHYEVCWATANADVLAALEAQIEELLATPALERDTTLLVLPNALPEFLDFNDFQDECDALIEAMHLGGVLQIASFHPDFQFAGTAEDDPTNCTNRSPYPSLHLLREDSVQRAVEAFPEAEAIFERNIERLTAMGMAGWQELQADATVPAALTGAAPVNKHRHGT